MKQQLSSLSLGKNNRDRWLWRWSLLSAAILCWLASGPDAPGGKCKISGGKLDLNVLFLYNETDLTGWKPVFTEASKLIYNATDGHLQFGKVNFYVACQPAKDAADIWISTGTGGASSHVNGCGNSGWHVFLSNIHKRNDASAHGQLGMVHELGHYVFGLRDEYGGCVKDPMTGAKAAPPGTQYQWNNSQVSIDAGGKAFFCASESGGTACIMDGGTTVSSGFTRTEWCSAGNHVGSRNLTVTVAAASIVSKLMTIENNQQCEIGSDCWTKVAAKLGLATVPNPPSTTAPAGHMDVEFNDIGAASRFVLCIDGSGSMAGEKITLAQTAARCFVANSRLPRTENFLTVPGDEVGVVRFDCSASVVSALAEMTSQAVKDGVNAAINGISADGSTSIGAGLRTSLNQLTGRGTLGCIEAIILLSDGIQNCGEEPSSVVPDISTRKAVVFSIALGADADAAQLGSIATGTGGKYFFAANAGALPAIFIEIQATVTGAPILERVKGTLEAGESSDIPILVDASLQQVVFTISGDGFEIALISPSGMTSTAGSQAPGVHYSVDGVVQMFDVMNPETGVWTLRVLRTAAGPGDVDVIATAPMSDLLTPHLQVKVPENLDVLASPDHALHIQAVVSQGPGVIGATVVAEITRPNGSKVILPLRDDGQTQDGDESSGDGAYGALFRDFLGNGSYGLVVRANTAGAYLGQNEDAPDQPLLPATPAVRTTSAAINVTGAPSIDCPADILVANDPGQCSAVVMFTATTLPGVTAVCVPPSGAVFPKGTTTVTCTASDTSGQCSFNVTVEDREAPLTACRPTSNPAGKNVPGANGTTRSGENPDGFYQLLAKDNCDSNPSLYIKDSAGTFIAGPFHSGDSVKITQAPGVTPNQKAMVGLIVAHIQLKGDALLYAVDADRNTSVPNNCLVPPRPK